MLDEDISNRIIYKDVGIGGNYMEFKLMKRIERLRKKLNKFCVDRNLVDPDVVELSQQLDLLLNKYHKFTSNKQLSFW